MIAESDRKAAGEEYGRAKAKIERLARAAAQTMTDVVDGFCRDEAWAVSEIERQDIEGGHVGRLKRSAQATQRAGACLACQPRARLRPRGDRNLCAWMESSRQRGRGAPLQAVLGAIRHRR